MSRFTLRVRPVVVSLLVCIALVTVGGCSMFGGGQKAKLASLEADLVAVGEPIASVHTALGVSGLTRDLHVVVRVSSDSVSAELLQDVIKVLDAHDDINYASGALDFLTLNGDYVSITSTALEIGIPKTAVDSGALRFARGDLATYVQQ